MADQNPKDINTVNNITSIDANDYLLVSDQGSALRKVNSNVVSKYAVETYNGTSLGGSNKTVQAAINDLNNNSAAQSLTNTNLDTLTSPDKVYYAPASNGCTNVPSGVTAFGLKIARVSTGYVQQILRSSSQEKYERQYNGSTWTSWVKLPTRSEVDSLNSNALIYKGAVSGSLSDLTTPGFYYYAAAPSDAPSDRQYGQVIVLGAISGTAAHLLQIVNTSSYHIYYRRKEGNATDNWSDWREFTITAV